jgi:glycosyltransferase involved in cell wall biosynthesis
MPAGRSQMPLVSVGFPVFNEEASLPAALDSVLAQDYERLQVIVCDNASTDATAHIADEYAARDARVEVHRSEENRGAAVNFNRCFQVAEGDYFTWASGHDTRLPSVISRCVAELEADQAMALCYPRSIQRRLDESVEPITNDTLDTRGEPPLVRLQRTLWELDSLNIVHGVIRSSALARTRLFRRCFGADHVLLAELSVLGEFHQIDEELFVRTENRAPEATSEQRERAVEMSAVKGFARSRPYSVMGLEHVAGVWHASTGRHKPDNAAHVAYWFRRRWGRELAAEWGLLGGPQAGLRRASDRLRSRLTRAA